MNTDHSANQQSPLPSGIRYGQRKLLILLAIGFAPMIAAWSLYLSNWQPASLTANGTLITPAQPSEQWWLADNSDALLALRGHWVIVEVLPEPCNSQCRQAIQPLTQMHMALGKEAERVRRLWIGNTTSGIEDPYLTIHPRVPLAVPNQQTRFLVDPLGNLVMTYTQGQDVRQIMKDIKRLLKASSIG